MVFSKQGNELVVFTVTCTQYVTKQKAAQQLLLNNYIFTTWYISIKYHICDVNCPITARFVPCDQSISHRIGSHYVVFKLEYHARVYSQLQYWGNRVLMNTAHRKTKMMLSTMVEHAIVFARRTFASRLFQYTVCTVIIYIIHLKTLRSGKSPKYYLRMIYCTRITCMVVLLLHRKL